MTRDAQGAHDSYTEVEFADPEPDDLERKVKDMAERIVAECFLPGDFIREELDERGWTQAHLAEIIGKTPGMVNKLINGKRKVTPDIAQGLSAAFGTSAEYWTNLETAYASWNSGGTTSPKPISPLTFAL